MPKSTGNRNGRTCGIRYLRGMEQIQEQIRQYTEEINAFNSHAPEAVENFRIRFLGTKGIVKNLMGEMKNVPADQRSQVKDMRDQAAKRCGAGNEQEGLDVLTEARAMLGIE